MKAIKRNLFLAATPYQLLTAYNLCCLNFSSDEFHNEIYFLKSEKMNYNFSNDLLEKNTFVKRFSLLELPLLIQKLKQEDFFRFLFFQENSIFNKYLAFHLKKRGAIIALGPDGTKPYGIFKKDHEMLSILKDTIKDYKELKSNGFKLPTLFFSKYYRYGSFRILDEVWLQYPSLFDKKHNKTKGTIKQLPDLNVEVINRLSLLLQFKDQLKQYKDVILYFNQPFYFNELIQKEFDILEGLQSILSDKQINVKLHPSTNPEVKRRMYQMPSLNIIEDNMPAEFYLAKVSDSIILTGWSAATMHKFPTQNNTCYYLYPLYKQAKDKTLSQINLVGFPHIQMVTSLNEIILK
jgi:hypothetical protein